VEHRKNRYSIPELILFRLFDYSHPFTICIYGLVLVLVLLFKALLGVFCRRQKTKKKTD
jgi:hypothetical protein